MLKPNVKFTTTSLQAFFNYPEMREIMNHFCVFHVNAPGQEDSAHRLPEAFEYPSLDEMAEQLNEVINHFSVVRYVGLGVGLGGNVMIRHALKYPERVDSLVLVNTLCTAPGWIEWGYQKRNVAQLRQHGVSQVGDQTKFHENLSGHPMALCARLH